MRTKLALLLALCSGAELLILDEPTSGLDPAATEEVLQALVAHVAREATHGFSRRTTVADVEQIADRVAIVDRGRALVDEARSTICARATGAMQLVFDGAAPEHAFRSPGVVSARSARAACSRCSSSAGRRADRGRSARAGSRCPWTCTPVTLKEIFLETVAAES